MDGIVLIHINGKLIHQGLADDVFSTSPNVGNQFEFMGKLMRIARVMKYEGQDDTPSTYVDLEAAPKELVLV